MITSLLSSIFLLALAKSDGAMRVMYCAFSSFMGIHYLFAGEISAKNWGYYYITSALLLYALSQCFEYEKKHAIFHAILSVGILANFIGYVFWYYQLNADPHRLIYLGLYSYTIIILVSRRLYGQGNGAALSFFSWICSCIDENHSRNLASAQRKET